MQKGKDQIEQFEQYAKDKLNNHLGELKTRYENEAPASRELQEEATQQHQKLYAAELEEKIAALANNEQEHEWLKAELENIKARYLSKMDSPAKN